MKVQMHRNFCFPYFFTLFLLFCPGHYTSEESHGHINNDPQVSEEPFPQNRVFTIKTSLPEAEHEQKYYIEKLFHRYGENGRLSYYGLERLLSSLGLGEVKVVEIGHEDIGHDPVSHLDILDVQEGKHLHVHDQIESHPHTNKKEKESVSTRHKTANKNHFHHVHNVTYNTHNNSLHNQNAAGNHVTLKGRTNEPLASANATQAKKKPLKHKKRQKVTKTIESTVKSQTGFEQAQDENKHFYIPFTPGNVGDDNIESKEHGQGPAYLHRNIHKREVSNDQTSLKVSSDLQKSYSPHDDEVHEHDECLNVTQLLSYYGLNLNSPISPDQFAYLCPALLYQIDSRFCIKHFTDLEVETLEVSRGGASAWICGLISITVISLLSLLGVILIPVINQGCFKFLLNFLIALAVGTLMGDALLHLMPHSRGGHDHSSKEIGHSLDNYKDLNEPPNKQFLVENDSVMKGLVALGGIYTLFIIENCLRMFKQFKERKSKPSRMKQKQKVEDSVVGRKLYDHKLNWRSDAEWLHQKPMAVTEDPAASGSQQIDQTQTSYVDSAHQLPLKVLAEDAKPHIITDDSCEDEGQFMNHVKVEMPKKDTHNKHSHHSHGHSHSGKDMKDAGIASMAWMVIMGDGMHNFSDGLAIAKHVQLGAAFSADLTGGISTSIAVFCHELPHELGDFAVLLNAGMTVKQAIVYNLLSAMMAYVGMLIGTAVGQYANNITLWIFAITAGMFLYVALVDMLPEMLHKDHENEEQGYCPLGQFILQNLGLLLGFAIMLVIAIYEDKIVFDIHV